LYSTELPDLYPVEESLGDVPEDEGCDFAEEDADKGEGCQEAFEPTFEDRTLQMPDSMVPINNNSAVNTAGHENDVNSDLNGDNKMPPSDYEPAFLAVQTDVAPVDLLKSSCLWQVSKTKGSFRCPAVVGVRELLVRLVISMVVCVERL